jgi:hypothetical protein
MNKKASTLVGLLLCLSLLVTSFGTVEAKKVSTSTTLPDPQVSLVTGGSKFSVELLPIVNLPGVVTLSDGMLAPAGFTAGAKQFGGIGLNLTGLVHSSAKVCFPVTGVSEGWGGQVGEWNGTQWVLLPTAITAAEEQPFSWGCATVNENATYAFISWIVDASKLPQNKGCGYPIVYAGPLTGEWTEPDSEGWETAQLYGFGVTLSTSSVDMTGQFMKVTIISVKPHSNYLSFSEPISGTLEPFPVLNSFVFELPSPYPVMTWNEHMTEYTVRLDFGTCVQDVTVKMD